MPSAVATLFAPSSTASASSNRAVDRRSSSISTATRFEETLGKAFTEPAADPTPSAEEPAAEKPANIKQGDRTQKSNRAKNGDRKVRRKDDDKRETPETEESEATADVESPETVDSEDGAADGDIVDPRAEKSAKPAAAETRPEVEVVDPTALAIAPVAGTAPAEAVTEASEAEPARTTPTIDAIAQAAGVEVDPSLQADVTADADLPPDLAAAAASVRTAKARAQPVARPSDDLAIPDEAQAVEAPDSQTETATKLEDVTNFQEFANAFAAPEAADDESDALTTATDEVTLDPVALNEAHQAKPQQLDAPRGTRETQQPPEAKFVQNNHENIVDGVRGELLPNGGTMRLKLDPPELGSMQVSLHMRDGVVTASFQTTNDEATRLLSHTLSDLRSSLEAQGITVDRLHVQQAPKDEGASNNNGNNSDDRNARQGLDQQRESRRDQQRKDLVQKLWDKLAGKGPLDLTA